MVVSIKYKFSVYGLQKRKDGSDESDPCPPHPDPLPPRGEGIRNINTFSRMGEEHNT